jgi:hypothetical protein
MRKVSLAIFIAFVGLTIAYRMLGGWFDRKFWLEFLPGLIANLLILALGVLVIDSILSKERLGKLKLTNVSQSRFVLFLTCRLAYLILEQLGLATQEDVKQNDPNLDFEFARGRLRGIDLADVFRDQLMQAADRQAFAGRLAEIVTEQAQGISKSLKAIYPRPDPAVTGIAEHMNEAASTLAVFKDYVGMFAEVNAEVAPEGRFNQDQIDLLTRSHTATLGKGWTSCSIASRASPERPRLTSYSSNWIRAWEALMRGIPSPRTYSHRPRLNLDLHAIYTLVTCCDPSTHAIKVLPEKPKKRDQYVTYRPSQTLIRPHQTDMAHPQNPCKYSVFLMSRKWERDSKSAEVHPS